MSLFDDDGEPIVSLIDPEPPRPLAPDATLFEARQYVQALSRDGVKCPCCGQHAQTYRRKINSGMARALALMFKADPARGWIHKPTVLRGIGAAARDESLLRFWGLIEEEATVREDGGRAGWWRVTERGELFLRARIRVPKYALVYAGGHVGMEGDDVTFVDCLGQPFDLLELLEGR